MILFGLKKDYSPKMCVEYPNLINQISVSTWMGNV